MEAKKKNPIPCESQKENSIQLKVRSQVSKSGSFMRRDRRNSKHKKKSMEIIEEKLVEEEVDG